MIEYPIGASGQLLIFTPQVIEHFKKNRQLRWNHREAGGQLFARFDDHRIVVEEATGPRRSDRRSRTSYIPDRKAEQIEISDRHQLGKDFVGDWHTHPEKYPTPSHRDQASISECVASSTHNLNGFVLVIVGQAEPPEGLYVVLNDGKQGFELQPLSISG